MAWGSAAGRRGVRSRARRRGRRHRTTVPETTTTKQIYRRVAGTGDFHLVGQITDTKKSTFVDNTATEDLSNLVLTGTPQEIKPQRTFIVSLKNVGEIRPQGL